MVEGIPVPSFGANLNKEEYQSTKGKLDKHQIKYEIISVGNQEFSETLWVKDFTGNNILLNLVK